MNLYILYHVLDVKCDCICKLNVLDDDENVVFNCEEDCPKTALKKLVEYAGIKRQEDLTLYPVENFFISVENRKAVIQLDVFNHVQLW